jgi:hypothetical protein
VDYDPDYPNKAIGITDLIIDGTTYNVEFLERDTAIDAYGPLRGDFDFGDQSSAEDAMLAVADALNAEAVRPTHVGQKGTQSNLDGSFYIGYGSDDSYVIPLVESLEAAYNTHGSWAVTYGPKPGPYLESERTWALFSVVLTDVKIGGRVIHLKDDGDGLILQNNGGDDLPIDGNGEFTFDTPQTPGDTYHVTVLQQPSNDQTCSVARGEGIAGTTDVTSIIVSCEPKKVLADVRVFVTSETFGADLGGVTGADAKCQAAADAVVAAELDGRTWTWTAWISDSTGDAIDRIPDGRYRLLDNTLVALDKDDLVTITPPPPQRPTAAVFPEKRDQYKRVRRNRSFSSSVDRDRDHRQGPAARDL